MRTIRSIREIGLGLSLVFKLGDSDLPQEWASVVFVRCKLVTEFFLECEALRLSEKLGRSDGWSVAIEKV